jgi:hypothetical protein
MGIAWPPVRLGCRRCPSWWSLSSEAGERRRESHVYLGERRGTVIVGLAWSHSGRGSPISWAFATVRQMPGRIEKHFN